MSPGAWWGASLGQAFLLPLKTAEDRTVQAGTVTTTLPIGPDSGRLDDQDRAVCLVG